MAKRNHVQAIIDATHAALGTTAPAANPPTKPKPSSLSGFAAKKAQPNATPPKAKKVKGASAQAIQQLAKGDW